MDSMYIMDRPEKIKLVEQFCRKNGIYYQEGSRNIERNFLIHENCLEATVNDYKKFLKGYLDKGGKISHEYNYDFCKVGWYVAKKNFELKPYYGARALNIIVPPYVEVKISDLGHSNLYYLKDFTLSGDFVPLYTDINIA